MTGRLPPTERELTAFMRSYEAANNSHDITRVLPFLAEHATYWFSDGSHQGIDAVRAAIERTFATIQDEVYEVRELEWPVVADDVAVCRYRFAWSGRVDGERRSGEGRGTNVIARQSGAWRIVHEHLSS
ncbi:YybH family protein [Streptomyces sp. NPDC050418]|uniref:YybH family protein n=1 Tax=Streptomyces sp. NPDC050418 TaxID=3365612 RepID=UPI00378DABF3